MHTGNATTPRSPKRARPSMQSQQQQQQQEQEGAASPSAVPSRPKRRGIQRQKGAASQTCGCVCGERGVGGKGGGGERAHVYGLCVGIGVLLYG